MSKNKGITAVPLIVIAVIVIIIIVLGYWFWREKTTSNLGSQIFKKIPKDTVSAETNPL